MRKEPSKLNDKKFPVITNINIQSNSYNITVIPETPIEQQEQNEETPEFLSHSVVSKTTPTNSTPQPRDTSTPVKEIEEGLKLYQLTLQPKKEHLREMTKLVTKLEEMGFNDTGCLNDAYTIDRNEILAFAMYYEMG